MVIFIHGFGSNGCSLKARLLKEYFEKEGIPFISPSLPYIPKLAINTLEQLINSYEDVHLIGSSLGGFFSLYLSSKFNLKCVLINPSIYPYNTLSMPKIQYSFFDYSTFSWTEKHINSLKDFEVLHNDIIEDNIYLLLQKGDEILDYNESLKKLPYCKKIIEEGGNHSFEGLHFHLDSIKDFFNL